MKLEPDAGRKSILTSATGRRISFALNTISVAGFGVMGGYALKFLLIVSFWTGALIGVFLYGLLLLSTVIGNEAD